MTAEIAQLHNVKALTEMVEFLIGAPPGVERMGCFYGPSGWGKTTAVMSVELMFDVIAIEVIEHTSKMDVLRQIQEPLGITSRPDISSRVRAVAAFMRETDQPLIIDDAQYLVKRKMIGIARDLYKAAGRVVPVILVGEERLPQSLTEVENLHNLVTSRVGAEPCSLDDAHHLAEIYASGIEVKKDLLREFVLRADGATRRVVGMLATARELALKKDLTRVGFDEWGSTPFLDGQPPVERKVSNLKPKVSLVHTTGQRKAAGQK